MAINTSGYVQVCEYMIIDPSKRKDKPGRNLLNAFKCGPSPAVISDGKVIVDDNLQSQDKEESPQEGNNSQQSSDSGAQQNDSQPAGNNAEGNNAEGGNESYHYSILESYLNLKPMFEDGETSDSGGNDSSDSGGSDTSDSGSDSSDSGSNDTSDSSDGNDSGNNNSESDDNKSDSNDDKEDGFKPGPHMYVQVLLPKEGCTVWHLMLDSRADKEAVRKALMSKKFKSAYTIASKDIGDDGIVPLSATTYMYKKSDANAPFVGYCNYAMDSGSEKAEEDSDTVIIAIAPFDGRGAPSGKPGKPNEDTVFRAVYNIINADKLTDGAISKLKNQKPKEGDDEEDDRRHYRDDDDEKDSSGSTSALVSQWLNSKFECVGNYATYDNFNKLRAFVLAQVTAKNVSYDEAASHSPLKYSKITEVKKSLIFY